MPAGNVARSRSTDRRFYGVAEALVVENEDPEKEGRVKLKFPWFGEQMITDWCRVAQFYAGNGYGSFYVPEVDDEVLVAFVHGDMRYPVVVGGLYNGSDKPATHRASDKDEKLIRTKAGHQIVLDDTSGEEKIHIIDKTENNHIVLSSSDDAITIEAKSGKLTLHAVGIEIKSDAEISVEAATTLDLKGATVNVEGQVINLN